MVEVEVEVEVEVVVGVGVVAGVVMKKSKSFQKTKGAILRAIVPVATVKREIAAQYERAYQALRDLQAYKRKHGFCADLSCLKLAVPGNGRCAVHTERYREMARQWPSHLHRKKKTRRRASA